MILSVMCANVGSIHMPCGVVCIHVHICAKCASVIDRVAMRAVAIESIGRVMRCEVL